MEVSRVIRVRCLEVAGGTSASDSKFGNPCVWGASLMGARTRMTRDPRCVFEGRERQAANVFRKGWWLRIPSTGLRVLSPGHGTIMAPSLIYRSVALRLRGFGQSSEKHGRAGAGKRVQTNRIAFAGVRAPSSTSFLRRRTGSLSPASGHPRQRVFCTESETNRIALAGFRAPSSTSLLHRRTGSL